MNIPLIEDVKKNSEEMREKRRLEQIKKTAKCYGKILKKLISKINEASHKGQFHCSLLVEMYLDVDWLRSKLSQDFKDYDVIVANNFGYYLIGISWSR